MEIYHGSYIEVTKPLAQLGRRNLDFGNGFYTTRKMVVLQQNRL